MYWLFPWVGIIRRKPDSGWNPVLLRELESGDRLSPWRKSGADLAHGEKAEIDLARSGNPSRFRSSQVTIAQEFCLQAEGGIQRPKRSFQGGGGMRPPA